MNIDTSAITLVNATISQFNKKSVAAAKKINVNSQWTKSLTKGYLTDYAEGLSCAVFDRRFEYITKKIKEHVWLVCYHDFLEDNKLIESNSSNFLSIKNQNIDITKFHRVREVSISRDKHISCSCGYTQRWYMPCVHICAVIKDMEYLTADLFHIRWWKHFDYVYKKGNSSMDAKTRHSLEYTLYKVRKDHFLESNGKYKGVPLYESDLLRYLQKLPIETLNKNDKHLDKMLALKKMKDNDEPLLKYSTSYQKYMTHSPINNDDTIEQYNKSNKVDTSTSFELDFDCIEDIEFNSQ